MPPLNEKWEFIQQLMDKIEKYRTRILLHLEGNMRE